MRILFLIIHLVFLTHVSFAELGAGTSAPTDGSVQNPNVTAIDTNQEETAWREENNCPPPPKDTSPAALSCAKGVIASLGAVVTTPYALFRADEQCYNDKDYKKGLMSVVAPLLTGDGRVAHDFSSWPEDSEDLLQNSPVYQSYMNLSCNEVMSMVTNRERRTLAIIHNKELKQTEYERYLSRAPEDPGRIAQAERRYPAADRMPTPEEATFKRLYDTRKAMLEPGSNERFLQRAGNKALCLWKNTTVKSICEMGTDVAIAVGTLGVGLAGTGAKAAIRTAAREGAGEVAESARATTLRRNGALTDSQREIAAQARLGRDLTSSQKDAVIEAHNVGSNRAGAGIGNYTQAEIAEKTRILNGAGFSAVERRMLMEDGITGRPAGTVSGQVSTAPFSTADRMTIRTPTAVRSDLNNRTPDGAMRQPSSDAEFASGREFYEARAQQFAKDPTRQAQARADFLRAGRPTEYLYTYSRGGTRNPEFNLSPAKRTQMQADLTRLKAERAALVRQARESHNDAMRAANAAGRNENARYVAGEGMYSNQYVSHMTTSMDEAISLMEGALAD